MADDAPLVPHPLPELARSLRRLGRPSDDATEAAHAAVFVPLLDARARASRGEVREILVALRGAALAARIEAAARTAAAEGVADAARARARVARARELLEPLRDALALLDQAAPDAERAGAPSEPWDVWVEQLRRVFSATDAACGELARLLGEPHAEAPPASWIARRRGGAR